MRWSKLKSLLEQNFAPSLGKRIAINSTTYDGSTEGHAWITLDKVVIADYCTRAKERAQYGLDPSNPRPELLSEFGEMGRQDVYESCWAYIHDITVDDALAADNPLLQSLAVLDRRLGKRRMAKLDPHALHPLAHKLLEIRAGAEGVRLNASP